MADCVNILSFLLDQKRITLLASLDLVGHPTWSLATTRPRRSALGMLVLWLYNASLVFARALGWSFYNLRLACCSLAIAYGLASACIRRNTSRA